MAPRVVVVSLASDFGCQVQMTNIEDDLLDVLGLIDLSYWQLASSGHMPAEYDVAIVEGAVTTEEHVELLKRIRSVADVVMVIGACAVTGGIPAMAGEGDLEQRFAYVYGTDGANVARGRISPGPVKRIIGVDYEVPGCPIDTAEFLRVLSHALQGLANRLPQEPLCAICKTKENVCLFDKGQICLGMFTRTGCGARCVSLGRPCTGCRGLAADANVESAMKILAEKGYDIDEVTERLAVFNTREEVFSR
ncbi:MAG: NADH:ubiquinone oxidoreductase [Actinomycetota bacterium]|jgi:sulfhydrogenase subunit delta|nr:NADH:ubiquinone oxidoreductase [Actinomycetota bacterium]